MLGILLILTRDVCIVFQDMFLVVAMGPPGGGRTRVSGRLQSRFNLINMTFPQVQSMFANHKILQDEWIHQKDRHFLVEGKLNIKKKRKRISWYWNSFSELPPLHMYGRQLWEGIPLLGNPDIEGNSNFRELSFCVLNIKADLLHPRAKSSF